MATLTTNAEILNWVLFNANEPEDGSSDFHAKAIESLNRAYREIWNGGGALMPGMSEPWLWLKKDPPGVLTLEPVHTTGTAEVTNNSATVTLSVSPTFSLAGRFFRVDDHPDMFRITAHSPNTPTLTLDSVYTGETNAGASYRAMKLEYTLASDILRVMAPMRVYAQSKDRIDGMDLSALEKDYPLNYVESGTPDVFAMVTETKVRFNRYGGTSTTELIRIEYDYLVKPATELDDNASEPLIPLEYRQVLADFALMYLLIAKSDSRADVVGKVAQAGLVAMAQDNRDRLAQMSMQMGAITPRLGQAKRWGRGPLRTTSGVIIG